MRIGLADEAKLIDVAETLNIKLLHGRIQD
jgi:hypothetical protein